MTYDKLDRINRIYRITGKKDRARRLDTALLYVSITSYASLATTQAATQRIPIQTDRDSYLLSPIACCLRRLIVGEFERAHKSSLRSHAAMAE